MQYCASIYQTQRWKTREVNIGKVGVGAHHPIRIQSMTTSDTRDIEASALQIMRLSDQGCEIARVTVQGMKEAEACEGIKNLLIKKGYDIPLVADIHFYPPAGERVVDFVEKVRVNPGNYVDKRAIFKKRDYDNASYLQEVLKIKEGFSPLVKKCKKLNRAMRIGTNHGSLSDRIMNRYGDTPRGMVESALEFARVCRELDYHNFLFSMKASNPLVMIQAYRLLVAEMMRLGWDYPLHLGVTEAGEGEDGRIKSAVGIGALLLDGIGDTIRVSLTEDPWNEIDPCKRLIALHSKSLGRGIRAFEETKRSIETISAREVVLKDLHRDGSLILKFRAEDLEKENFFDEIGCKWERGRYVRTLSSADLIWVDGISKDAEVLTQLHQLGVGVITSTQGIPNTTVVYRLEEVKNCPQPFVLLVEDDRNWEHLLRVKPEFILFSPKVSLLHETRRFYEWIQSKGLQVPLLLYYPYQVQNKEDLLIQMSAELGSLLCDKLVEGVCLDSPFGVRLGFNLLQACRMRHFKTDFISCPGCGRTLFDLQEVSRQIRAKTAHLPGVKIAIMGCIVNGPGEMADADFGYVGSGRGKVDLYKGKICVEKAIDSQNAVERLIELIKSSGLWVN